MKNLTLKLSIVIVTVFISYNVFSDCSTCTNTLSSCTASGGGTVTFPTITDMAMSGPPVIIVSGSPSASGCVTAYNNCIVNQSCTDYPMAVLQVTSPTIKRVTTFRSKRRG